MLVRLSDKAHLRVLQGYGTRYRFLWDFRRRMRTSGDRVVQHGVVSDNLRR